MSSLTIGKKLYIGVGALVLLALALGITSYLTLVGVSEREKVIVGSTAKRQVLVARLGVEGAESLSLMKGLIIRGYAKDAPAIEKDHAQFGSEAASIQNDLASILPLITIEENRQRISQLQEGESKLIELEQTIHKDSLAGEMEAAFTANKLFLAEEATQKRLIEEITKTQQDLSTRDSEANAEHIDTSIWIIAALILIFLLVGMVNVFNVRQIIHLLQSSVANLSSATEQIASAAEQVSASSQSLASGSSAQAANIEETSSASSEVNSMAQRTSTNSKQTAEIVTRSQANVLNTKQSLDEMVLAMEDISGSSQKISKIIKVIDEIAFQTNILALNAAVEAARAGEAGMGFAVVADEVRNLAQRCAQAAKDTTDLIDESIQKSAGGKTKVDQVAVAIRAITGESATIKTLIDEISLGSIEQSRGMDQITQAITQMEQVTQTTAANAEESAAAAEQLKAQAQTLKDVVDTLKSVIDGGDKNSQPEHKLKPAANFSQVKRVATFRSAVSFPAAKPLAPKSTLAEKPAAFSRVGALAEFPLDDDFKEF